MYFHDDHIGANGAYMVARVIRGATAATAAASLPAHLLYDTYLYRENTRVFFKGKIHVYFHDDHIGANGAYMVARVIRGATAATAAASLPAHLLYDTYLYRENTRVFFKGKIHVYFHDDHIGANGAYMVARVIRGATAATAAASLPAHLLYDTYLYRENTRVFSCHLIGSPNYTCRNNPRNGKMRE